jgi:hypothetical protein
MENLLFGQHELVGVDNRLKHGIINLVNGTLVNSIKTSAMEQLRNRKK